MAYNTISTIPEEPSADDALLANIANKPKTTMKGVIAGAAATAFILGLVAATALSATVTPAQTSLAGAAALTEIPVALVDCPEDAESIANDCTRADELCTCSESYGNCPTDGSSYDVCRMVTDSCADDASWTSEDAGTCAAIAKMSTTYETGSTAEGDGFILSSREKACAARGANGKYAFEACQRACATCPGSGGVCKSSMTWAFEGVKHLNCDWVAEKRERCTESGIAMEEFEESEDDEDPNKPGPVEAYAFRACGKACGTCE